MLEVLWHPGLPWAVVDNALASHSLGAAASGALPPRSHGAGAKSAVPLRSPPCAAGGALLPRLAVTPKALSQAARLGLPLEAFSHSARRGLPLEALSYFVRSPGRPSEWHSPIPPGPWLPLKTYFSAARRGLPLEALFYAAWGLRLQLKTLIKVSSKTAALAFDCFLNSIHSCSHANGSASPIQKIRNQSLRILPTLHL